MLSHAQVWTAQSNSWQVVPLSGDGGGREYHTAVANTTGGEYGMLVFGGLDVSCRSAMRHLKLSTLNWTTRAEGPDPRRWHTAVWAHPDMLLWGGSCDDYFGDGWRYNFDSDSWSMLTSIGAPSARDDHSATWAANTESGLERYMLVWGGYDASGAVGNGAIYDNVSDQWSAMIGSGSPSARYDHTAVWTVSEGSRSGKLIIWGGVSPGANVHRDGGVYSMN